MAGAEARALGAPFCLPSAPPSDQARQRRGQLQCDTAQSRGFTNCRNHVWLPKSSPFSLQNRGTHSIHQIRSLNQEDFSVVETAPPPKERQESRRGVKRDTDQPTANIRKAAPKSDLRRSTKPGQLEVDNAVDSWIRTREAQQAPAGQKPNSAKQVGRRRDFFRERFGPFGFEPDAHVRKAIEMLRTAEDEAAVRDMLETLSRTAKGLMVTLFNTLVKEKQVNHCLQVLRFMVKEPGYTRLDRTFNMAIKALADAGRLARAEALFTEMKEAGIAPDTVTYNILITGYAKRGLMRDAENVLAAMKGAGLKPDAWSYSAMIVVHSKSGQAEGAEQMMQDMLEQGVLPNVFAYTALIAAYARAGDVEKAEATFEGMQQVGCAPDIYAFSAMIDAYAKQGLVAQAERTFRAMLQAGHEPSVVTYSAMVAAYAKGGHVEKAEKILQVMQEAGCAPNLFTFSSMMEAYVQQKRFDDAEAILEFVRAAGLHPSVQMYTTLITAFGKAEEVAKAIKYWKLMRKAGCPPDQVAYLSMIELYKKIDRPKRVQKLQQELEMANPEDKDLMSEDFFEVQ